VPPPAGSSPQQKQNVEPLRMSPLQTSPAALPNQTWMLLRTSPFKGFSNSIALKESEMGRWLVGLGFFDVDERLKRLSDLGDDLEAFALAVDFEMFRPDLVAGLGYSDGMQGGRPPFDPVMMFKILVIRTRRVLDQRLYVLHAVPWTITVRPGS
jgi:hypothetical protein